MIWNIDCKDENDIILFADADAPQDKLCDCNATRIGIEADTKDEAIKGFLSKLEVKESTKDDPMPSASKGIRIGIKFNRTGKLVGTVAVSKMTNNEIAKAASMLIQWAENKNDDKPRTFADLLKSEAKT